MKKYGLIGYPLGTRSQRTFSMKSFIRKTLMPNM